MARPASPRRRPPRSGRLRGPISSAVTIHWDRWGVAHVRAGSDRDVFVGLGYAMAQDRLWQLDYMRRQARGQRAASKGPSQLGHRMSMGLRAAPAGCEPLASVDSDATPKSFARLMHPIHRAN